MRRSPAEAGPSFSYRPELDGLRAVAVVAVVIYHAGFTVLGREFFAGGFLGVDIFFVLSGYLITLILLKEMARDSFTFLGFYERRARRILPALMVVMVATVPFAWVHLLPDAFKSYAGSLAASALFGSNVFFWREDQYAADASALKPFLHTWSLSVEEQFYLLFPVVLLLCWRFCRRHVTVLFVAGFVASLLLADWASTRYVNANFFLAPSRAWELLAGALLAKLEIDYGRYAHRLASAVLPALGLLMIIVPMLVLDDHTPHPSFVTLIPVVGTMLLIWFSGREDFASRLLSGRVFVAVGLISYSLYLWHQPVFAFSRIRATDAPQALDKLGWIVAALVLAALSYWLVEKPFRNKQWIKSRLLWSASATAPAVIAVAAIYAVASDGLPTRFEAFPDFYFDVVQATAEDDSAGRKAPCYNYSGGDDYCVFHHGAGDLALITVGDSHLRTLTEPLRRRTEATNATVIPLNRPACPLIIGIDRVSMNASDEYPCTSDYNERRIEVLQENAPAIAIVGGRMPLILEASGFDNGEGGVEEGNSSWRFVEPGGDGSSPASLATVRDRFTATIQRLLRNGVKVVLVYPIPEVGWNVPQRLFELLPTSAPEDLRLWVRNHQISTSYEVFQTRTASSYAVYDSVPAHPALIRIYPEHAFCNTRLEGRCIAHDEDHVFYRDDDHLSDAGAERVVDMMFDRMAEQWGLVLNR